MKNETKLLGSFLLFLSITLNILGLWLLRKYAETPSDGVYILLLAFAMSISLFIIPSVRRGPVLPDFKNGLVYFLLWGFGLCGIYFFYFFYPNYLSLSELILAQSTVPFLGVIFSGDIKEVRVNREHLFHASPLVPLFFIVVLRWKDINLTHFLVFSLTLIFFLVTQISIRKLVKLYDPWWCQARLSLLMVLLLAISLMQLRVFFNGSFNQNGAIGLLLGITLLVIQGSYLIGIKKTPPILSSLCLSLSVPLALGIEMLSTSKNLSINECSLALIYCMSVAFLAFTKGVKQTQI